MTDLPDPPKDDKGQHEGDRLHAALRELRVPRLPEHLCSIGLQLVPNCFGVAVIDTATDRDHALLAMETSGDHPPSLLELLPGAIHEMMSGPITTRVIDRWDELKGRRSEVDDLRFTTGPVSHYVQRLKNDPTVVIAVATMDIANPRTVMLNVGRIAEMAVVER